MARRCVDAWEVVGENKGRIAGASTAYNEARARARASPAGPGWTSRFREVYNSPAASISPTFYMYQSALVHIIIIHTIGNTLVLLYKSCSEPTNGNTGLGAMPGATPPITPQKSSMPFSCNVGNISLTQDTLSSGSGTALSSHRITIFCSENWCANSKSVRSSAFALCVRVRVSMCGWSLSARK